MTPFYTLLRVVPNPASGEAVVVGVVLFDGSQYRMRVSQRKTKLAILLARENEAPVWFALQRLQGRVEQDTAARRQTMLTGEVPVSGSLLARGDWEYLSRYSNGALHVDAPLPAVLFEGEDGETVFDQLYSNLVDQKAEFKRKRVNALVKPPVRAMIERVKPKVHTNIELSPRLLESLFFKLRLDCIGMNGSIIGAHSLPLEQLAIGTLQQHLTECRLALKSLTDAYKPKEPGRNVLYLFVDEPDSEADADKHKFWRAIQGDPVMPVRPTDAAEEVAEKIERSGAGKFLNVDGTGTQREMALTA